MQCYKKFLKITLNMAQCKQRRKTKKLETSFPKKLETSFPKEEL